MNDNFIAATLTNLGIEPTPENIMIAKEKGVNYLVKKTYSKDLDKPNVQLKPQSVPMVTPMVQTRPGTITGSSGMIAPVTPNNENQSFFQKYKTPLIIGGVALVGLYFLTRK